MGPTIIARNYAETLLTLAEKHGGGATVDEYAAALDDLAGLLRSDRKVREFLETPRIDPAAKQEALRTALRGRVPELFLSFVLVVLEKRRQALLPAIAREYAALVDEAHDRVRAEVVLARAPDEALRRDVVAALEARLGSTILPTFRVEPALVGGVVVRVGDQIFDGSVRRRLGDLRRRLLSARLPEPVAG